MSLTLELLERVPGGLREALGLVQGEDEGEGVGAALRVPEAHGVGLRECVPGAQGVAVWVVQGEPLAETVAGAEREAEAQGVALRVRTAEAE